MREDETLLEYLIRLAKEGGEGYGELANQRLIRSRPDAARKLGLMPDQIMAGEFEGIDQIPSVSQDSLLPSTTRAEVVDSYPTDRASLEAISQWGGRGPAPEPDPALMQRMLTQPSATDLAITNWAGVGQAPGEDPSLMQQDLEQTRAKEQAELYDQVTPGPITPRVPAADLDLSPIPSVPGVGDPVKETDLETSLVDKYRESTQGFLNKILPDPEEAMDKTPTGLQNVADRLKRLGGKGAQELGISVPKDLLRPNTSFEDLLKGIFGMREGTAPGGHLAASGVGGELYKLGLSQFGPPQFEKAATGTLDLGVVAKQLKDRFTGEGEEETSVFLSDFDPDKAVKKEVDANHVSETKKNNAKKDKAKSRVGEQSPAIAGQFTNKKDYYSSMGVPKNISGELDRIDSTYNTMSIIAMLGGAGESRAADNYRRKSLQRLRLESDMSEREWQRAYKVATTPLVTWHWHDPLAGVLPISLPKGVHPGDVGYSREGFMQTKPVRSAGKIDWDMYDEMYDGTENSYTMMIYKYANDNYGAMMQQFPEEALVQASVPVMARYPKKSGAKWWSPGNKQQLIKDIKEGKKGAVIEAIKMIGEYPKELEDALKKAFPDLFR